MTTYNWSRGIGSTITAVHDHGLAYMTEIPGTAFCYHISHSNVVPTHRGKGLGSLYHRERLDHIETLGATLATCVVNKNNVAEIKILQRNGWKFLHEFPDKEREETLILCCRDIGEVPYKADQQGESENDI